MYYRESENFVSKEQDSHESISAIDRFLAARSGLFFTMPTLELHTDIDAQILGPYVEYYVSEKVLQQQERLRCDCGQHYRLNNDHTADCDICDRRLASPRYQLVSGFLVVKEPIAIYEVNEQSQNQSGKLSGPELAPIESVIVAAFSEEEFERLLHYRLDIKLDEIISGNVGLRNKVYAALEYLNARSQVMELLDAARKENNSDQDLRSIAEKYLRG